MKTHVPHTELLPPRINIRAHLCAYAEMELVFAVILAAFGTIAALKFVVPEWIPTLIGAVVITGMACVAAAMGTFMLIGICCRNHHPGN